MNKLYQIPAYAINNQSGKKVDYVFKRLAPTVEAALDAGIRAAKAKWDTDEWHVVVIAPGVKEI